MTPNPNPFFSLKELENRLAKLDKMIANAEHNLAKNERIADEYIYFLAKDSLSKFKRDPFSYIKGGWQA